MKEAADELERMEKDAARLNVLEAQAEPGMKWIARPSTTGRGYRLHQDPNFGEHATARDAIDALTKGA